MSYGKRLKTMGGIYLPSTPVALVTDASIPPPPPPPSSSNQLFSAASPWNTSINWANATIGTNPYSIAQWCPNLGHLWCSLENSGDVIWYTRDSDPVWQCTVTKNGPYVGKTVGIHMPAGTHPANSSDGNMHVWNSDTGMHFDFYAVSGLNSSARTMSVEAVWPLAQTEDGWGTGTWPNGSKRGSRAAGCQFGPGGITMRDWNAGKVLHALALAGNPGTWAKSTVYLPATGQDGYAQNVSGGYGGVFPLGGMLAIPPTSRGGPSKPGGLSTIGSMVWDCARDYGLYAVDSTGGLTFYADGGNEPMTASMIDPLRYSPYDGDKVINACRLITHGKPSITRHA